MAVKISEAQKLAAEMPELARREKPEAIAGQHNFQRSLTKLSEDKYAEYIRSLIDDIDKQGELLGRKADIKEFQKYREMITSLLNETVSNSYTFNRSDSFDTRGRHRIFSSIKRVNSELDELASELLSDQKSNIKVLHRIDDIRGLLVDLLL